MRMIGGCVCCVTTGVLRSRIFGFVPECLASFATTRKAPGDDPTFASPNQPFGPYLEAPEEPTKWSRVVRLDRRCLV